MPRAFLFCGFSYGRNPKQIFFVSIKIMDLCWRVTDVSGTEKCVLMALANHADELGLCWPSVSLIATMTCFSDRAVQKSLFALSQKGLITTSVSPGGKSNRYVINGEQRSPLSHANSKLDGEPSTPLDGERRSPRTTFTPNVVHRNGERGALNGERGSPKPLRTVKEPSIEYIRPPEVEQKLWSDFLAHRKTKKAKVTEIAMRGILREAEKASMTLADVLTKIIERNWVGFEAEWVRDKFPKKTAAIPMALKDYREGVNEDGSLH